MIINIVILTFYLNFTKSIYQENNSFGRLKGFILRSQLDRIVDVKVCMMT